MSELDDILEHFERCWPWIEAALAHNAYEKDGVKWPTHRKEHVWERIVTGKSYFWPGQKSAILTELHTYPTGLKVHTTWLAGGNLKEIKSMMVRVEDWGRSRGCHLQVGHGRKGWLRALTGYVLVGWRKVKYL